MFGYKKKNYSSSINRIYCKKQSLLRIQKEIKAEEFALYGSDTSPFYGLKNPSLPKIIEYLCDTYNLPYDLMMNTVYEKIIKDCFNKHLLKMKSCRSRDFVFALNEVKTKEYDYPDDYKVEIHEFFKEDFREIRIKNMWGHLKKSNGVYWSDEKLYLGDKPYKSISYYDPELRKTNYISGITIHNKKTLKTKYNKKSSCQIFDVKKNDTFSWIYHNEIIRMWDKQRLANELSEKGVKFSLTSSKSELMMMLMIYNNDYNDKVNLKKFDLELCK